ncbi:DUF975 family protein [Eubacteriales bacterium OttesenSCG-928-N13]|nr:DUF975 family protein [Eubacteriales bacterium OttesenSCG-928-N13]
MIDRIDIKEQAKGMMREHYWPSVALYAVPTLVMFVISFFCVQPIADKMYELQMSDLLQSNAQSMMSEYMTWFAMYFVILLICSLVSSLLSFVMSGGFIGLYRGKRPSVEQCMTTFKTNVGRKLWVSIKLGFLIFLWMLLGVAVMFFLLTVIGFIAGTSQPGMAQSLFATVIMQVMMAGVFILVIVKALSYSLVTSLMAEYPDIEAKQVIKLSVRMMNGYKRDMFVMSLSFLGWEVLSALTFGVLHLLFVGSYMQTAMEGLYTEIRNRAVYDGIVSLEELGESNMQLPPDEEDAEWMSAQHNTMTHSEIERMNNSPEWNKSHSTDESSETEEDKSEE